jgi:hypothetical protein
MKIRSNVHAGDALSNCQRQRDFWKARAFDMERIAKAPTPTNPPQPQPLPQPNPGPGGGWAGGVFYSDRSGWCG